MGLGSGPEPVALDALRACRLFTGLDERAMELIADALRVRRFRRGEVIFHAGDPGDSLFIVAAGSVKITVTAEDGAEPAILTTIGPGGFFGELALLDGAPRSATAAAVDARRDPRAPTRRIRSDGRHRGRAPAGACWRRWPARSGV